MKPMLLIHFFVVCVLLLTGTIPGRASQEDPTEIVECTVTYEGEWRYFGGTVATAIGVEGPIKEGASPSYGRPGILYFGAVYPSEGWLWGKPYVGQKVHFVISYDKHLNVTVHRGILKPASSDSTEYTLVVIDRDMAWKFVDGLVELPKDLREFHGNFIESNQVAISGAMTRDNVLKALRSSRAPLGFVRCGSCGRYARKRFCENQSRHYDDCDPDR